MATTTVTQVAAAAKRSVAAGADKKIGLLLNFASKAGAKLVSAQELADNCGIGSDTGRAWVCIHGHVFDITEFSKVHPGGHSIRFAAGRDGTCLVESYHPGSSLARVEAALLHRSTYIGVLAPADPKLAAEAQTPAAALAAQPRPDDAFFTDVRARVDKLIASKSHRYAYDFLGAAECVLTFLLYCYSVYAVGVLGSWPWTIMLGVLTGRLGMLMHMGNHCAISSSPTINKLAGFLMDIAGSNATIWGYEHQVAHHVEPNEYQHDNDCEIGNPLVRMHPEIPHTEPQRWQHIVVPTAMTVGLFKWYVGDFGHFLAKHVGNVRMAIDHKDWYKLLAFKAAWFALHVILPVYYQGWGRSMAQLFVFMAIGGHYLENIFIVNHIQNGLVPPANAHWASKQVMATANWASGSVFWNWFSGGLNHQIEHHMFPSLSYYWYAHVSDVVRECAREHGLPYQNFDNFAQAWWAMFTFLRDLGHPDFVSKTGQKAAPPADTKKAA